MLLAAPYRVELADLFDGPLDLLLYLVRKEEINVLDLSLSRIIDQFLEYLEILEIIDFDVAADFLVTAATLAEIKSRLALMRDEEEAESPEEEELSDIAPGNFVAHLLAYRRLKEAAENLQEQALAWHDRYPRLADDRPDMRRSPARDFIKDVEVWDLVGAFARIVRKKSREEEHQVRFDDTPIHVYVERIGERIRQEGRILFQELFARQADRSQVIGMFLAVLELVRHHGYRAQQELDFGEIWLMPPDASACTAGNAVDSPGELPEAPLERPPGDSESAE